MTQSALLGIDLGTSGCKIAAFSQRGRLLAVTRLPLSTNSPQPGHAEQAVESWWKAVCDGLRYLLARDELIGRTLLGVGICGHWPSLALYDVRGAPLRPAILWKDTRGILPPGITAGELSSRVGLPISYLPTLPVAKLAWLMQHEAELFGSGQLGWCFGAKSALVFLMTGRAVTDPVEAWWTGLAGTRGDGWEVDLAERLGISANSLPEIEFSWAPAGRVSILAAGMTGVQAGVPVAVGVADGVCCTVGANLQRPGDGALIHGSSMIVATPAPESLSWSGDEAIMRFPSSSVDSCDLLYTSTPSGSADAFVRRLLGGRKLARVRRQALVSPPLRETPLFVPHLEGITSPWLDLDMRGAWLNLGVGHTWTDLYRGVAEGVAFSVRQILDAFSDLGVPLVTVRLGGGGARNRALCQFYADVLGRPVARLTMPELGCLGAAMLAAVAAGVYPDLASAAAAMAGEAELVEPVGGQAVLEERYISYCRACTWLGENGTP
jgi:xylulokinase